MNIPPLDNLWVRGCVLCPSGLHSGSEASGVEHEASNGVERNRVTGAAPLGVRSALPEHAL